VISADLVQIVDLTVKEARDIRPFTDTTDDGRHYIELVRIDDDCEACEHRETRIVENDDGHRVEDRAVYRLKDTIRTIPLCREHLKTQPHHIELRDDLPEVESDG